MFKRRRGKLNLSYITDDATRRVTFKKRSNGLIKKMNELTTLCDVKACAVVYNPYEERPILYPDDPMQVFEVFSDFVTLSETEQRKKMYDQENYLKEKIAKTKEEVSRLRMDNRERKLTQLMHEFLVDKNKNFHSLSIHDLKDLNKLIDRHLREIEIHIHTLHQDMASPPPRPPPPPPSPPRDPLILVGQNQVLSGLEEIPVIDLPPVRPMEPLSSPVMAREDNTPGYVFANDLNNNKISMETNYVLSDQWFMEMSRNSQDVGSSSNNN